MMGQDTNVTLPNGKEISTASLARRNFRDANNRLESADVVDVTADEGPLDGMLDNINPDLSKATDEFKATASVWAKKKDCCSFGCHSVFDGERNRKWKEDDG